MDLPTNAGGIHRAELEGGLVLQEEADGRQTSWPWAGEAVVTKWSAASDLMMVVAEAPTGRCRRRLWHADEAGGGIASATADDQGTVQHNSPTAA